ncbi:MAG: uncharacterized protein KVP18_001659 [Porospora cf. gigantea A]|uniref:uncharacterized protein n=1 Tax=Porospora cf. gigantea A TaxID=2853593 RepID=UPI00355A7102|nr:MAG: hypothetical protein KVP18_001659 [Porospora cf. gigantea A]
MRGIHIAVVCIARAKKLEGQWLYAQLRYGEHAVKKTSVVQVVQGVGRFYSAFNFAYEESIADLEICDAVGSVLHILELDFGNVAEEVQQLTLTTPHGIMVVEYNEVRPAAIRTSHVSVYIKSIEPTNDLPATTFRVHYGSDVQMGEAMPSIFAGEQCGQESNVDQPFLFDFESTGRVVVIDLFDLEDMNIGISAVDLWAPRPTVDRIAGKCALYNRDGVLVARVMVKVLFWDYDKAVASVEEVFHDISTTETSPEGDRHDFSDMYDPLLMQAQNAYKLFQASNDPVLRSVQVTILDRIMMRMEALKAAQEAGASQKQTRAARLQIAALTRKPAARRRRDSMLQDVPEFEEDEPSLEDNSAFKPAGLNEFEQARAMVEHTACEISKFCEAYSDAVHRRPAVGKFVDQAEEMIEVAGENENVSFEEWLADLQIDGQTEIRRHQQLLAEARLLVAGREAMCQEVIRLLEDAEVLANSSKVKIVEKAVLPCRKVRYIRTVKVYHEKKKSAFDCCRPAYPNYSNVKLLGVECIPTQPPSATDPVLFNPSTSRSHCTSHEHCDTGDDSNSRRIQ